MLSLARLRRALQQASNKEDAVQLQRYFKTGPGDYGAGDRFLGIRMGALRQLARQYRDLAFTDVTGLLNSAYHEERMTALLILVERFQRADSKERRGIYKLYLDNLQSVNNWDLVDVSAPRIVGAWLYDKDRKPLMELAHSPHLWSRRIAILSTLYFIKQGDFNDTLRIARVLLYDDHDLIHKAVGWMLREVGKQDLAAEEGFLTRHHKKMPRTMLRYAIERFPEDRRRRYLNGTV